jgi:hypothetical protein
MLIDLTYVLVVPDGLANSNCLAHRIEKALEVAGAKVGSESGFHVLGPSSGRKALRILVSKTNHVESSVD